MADFDDLNQAKRILVAEDDPSILRILTMQLQVAGYNVIQAKDGAEAWQALERADLPDMVILDVLMPKMDGYQICRRIRETPRMTTLPVIILTALQDSASRLEGLEAGANDFLGKPWSKAELYARIRTLFRLKDSQDAIQKQHLRLGLLYDISRELSAYLNLEQMLLLMLARSAHVVEASNGSLVLLTSRGLERKIQIDETLTTKIISPPKIDPVEQAVTSRLLKLPRPLLVNDTAGKTDFLKWPSFRSLIAVPFVLKNKVRGFMMFLHNEPNWFDNEHLELLDSIARQATVTIENAWLFESVQEEQQRMAALLASMDDAVIATDREQRVLLVNPAGENLLEQSKNDLYGKPIQEVVKEPSLLALFSSVASQQHSLTSEIAWSQEITLYATVSPIGGGGQVAVIQNISPLKQLQAMQLATEQEKTARVRGTFERYMSPELVDRALSEERGLMERRERRSAAVLFADMRGFTRLTVRFSPDQVVTILNKFFTVMTAIAYAHSGTVFDIAGDELMIGFGVPFELSDPATAAIKAAVEMQTVFTDLSDEWYKVLGDTRLGLGVGIDFGEVIVGNVGSPTRMNYALVGLPVNTAHALVSTAADGEVRFSKAVIDLFNDRDLEHPVSPVPGVHLKGYDRPETVYCMCVNRSQPAESTSHPVQTG